MVFGTSLSLMSQSQIILCWNKIYKEVNNLAKKLSTVGMLKVFFANSSEVIYFYFILSSEVITDQTNFFDQIYLTGQL